MDGMNWIMGGMALGGLLLVALLALGIAALVKNLRPGRK